MTLAVIPVAIIGLCAFYFAIYAWGFLFVRRTSDLKTLHKYQKLLIWGPLALKKLETFYLKQLEECTSSEVASGICVATRNISPFVLQRAITLERILLIDELRNAVEEAREAEELPEHGAVGGRPRPARGGRR